MTCKFFAPPAIFQWKTCSNKEKTKSPNGRSSWIIMAFPFRVKLSYTIMQYKRQRSNLMRGKKARNENKWKKSWSQKNGLFYVCHRYTDGKEKGKTFLFAHFSKGMNHSLPMCGFGWAYTRIRFMQWTRSGVALAQLIVRCTRKLQELNN